MDQRGEHLLQLHEESFARGIAVGVHVKRSLTIGPSSLTIGPSSLTPDPSSLTPGPSSLTPDPSPKERGVVRFCAVVLGDVVFLHPL